MCDNLKGKCTKMHENEQKKEMKHFHVGHRDIASIRCWRTFEQQLMRRMCEMTLH